MSGPESSMITKDYIYTVLAANKNWAQRLNQTFPQYFPDPKDKQAPKVLWIGCSDSRVQESDATTALPGNVFVHRNIANQFHLHDDSALSVFAYAVKVLGTRHVVVVGHEHCGGAITALKEARRPPSAEQRHHTLCDSLYHLVETFHINEIHDKDSNDPNDAITRWLTPLVDRIRKLELPAEEGTAVRIVIEENVKLQIKNIVQLEDWVRRNVREPDGRPATVWVHGWVYDFATGFIRDLDVTRELGGGSE
ncbi:carbonic anhydrase [Boletus edulis BED1]|uniref:Carbonic anhydrase n=1 Tax=Boletus edulis BED1 TaxID=1328754 RepID=A0AAD4GKN2_BOLED|nr:carbonic anhydrase [Boletus edulis BED1]